MRGDAPAPCSLVWPAMRHAAGRARRCAATGTGTGAIYVSRGWCEKRPSSAVRGAVVYSYTYSFVCDWFGPHRCKRIFAHVRMTSYWGALGSHFSVLGGPGEALGSPGEVLGGSGEEFGGSLRAPEGPFGRPRGLSGVPGSPLGVPGDLQGVPQGAQGRPFGVTGLYLSRASLA